MPISDTDKLIARKYLLRMQICRKCYARNPVGAKKCRRCRSKRLRMKNQERKS
ncbi:MAG: 50S ribosomal protein L40e [Candidatus Hodarchaeota archaeon]